MFTKVNNFSVGTLRHQLISTKEHISLGQKNIAKKAVKKPKINIPAPETKIVESFKSSVAPVTANFIRGAYKKDILLNEDEINLNFAIPGFNVLQSETQEGYQIEEKDLHWLKSQNLTFNSLNSDKETHETTNLSIDESIFEDIVLVFESLTGTEIPILESKAVENILNNSTLFAKYSNLIKNSKVSLEITEIKRELSKQVKIIYAWWIKKRQSLNKPLLRVYWPRTLPSDQNPELVFRARERERYKLRKKKNNDIDQFYKLFQFLKDTEFIGFMSKLIQRREQLKKLKILYNAGKATAIDGKVLPGLVKAISREKSLIRKVDMRSAFSATQEVLYFADKVKKQMPSVLASGYTSSNKKSNVYNLAKQNQIDKRSKKQKKLRVKNNEELAANFIKCLEVYTPKNRKQVVSREKRMKLRRNRNFNESLLGPVESKPLVPPQRFLVEGCTSQQSIFDSPAKEPNYSFVDEISPLHNDRVLLNLKRSDLHFSKKRKRFIERTIIQDLASERIVKQKHTYPSLDSYIYESDNFITKNMKDKVSSLLNDFVKEDFTDEIKVISQGSFPLLKSSASYPDRIPNFTLEI